MTYVLFNPLADNKQGESNSQKLKELLVGKNPEFKDITKSDYPDFIKGLSADDEVIVAGGDGTLNRFANAMYDAGVDFETLKPQILYYPCGSGNDFMRDVQDFAVNGIVAIKDFLKNLPKVTVNGKTSRFINGIGYGIEGYCCEVGDELRKKSDKPVNYAGIAIKGVLFNFKPRNAKVTIDDKTYQYKKVWLAPSMNGCYMGGGMKIAPDQERTGKDRKLSCVVWFGSGRLKTLMVFPSIFKGEHVTHKEMIQVHEGKKITVEFDKPCALQIDGETVLGVTSYTAEL